MTPTYEHWWQPIVVPLLRLGRLAKGAAMIVTSQLAGSHPRLLSFFQEESFNERFLSEDPIWGAPGFTREFFHRMAAWAGKQPWATDRNREENRLMRQSTQAALPHLIKEVHDKDLGVPRVLLDGGLAADVLKFAPDGEADRDRARVKAVQDAFAAENRAAQERQKKFEEDLARQEAAERAAEEERIRAEAEAAAEAKRLDDEKEAERKKQEAEAAKMRNQSRGPSPF